MQPNIERLKTLANFLRNLDEMVFSISQWYDAIMSKSVNNITRPDAVEFAHECGSTACALGWAVTIPEFKEAGLTLSIIGAEPFTYPTPYFEGFGGYVAASKFFSIPQSISQNFFGPSAYEGEPSPKDVAARIEVYLDDTDLYHRAIDFENYGLASKKWLESMGVIGEDVTEEDLRAIAAGDAIRAKLPESAW